MNISWGSYQSFEGPWFRGRYPYKLSSNPTENEEIIAVITATEGGTYDAINMYDICLWTVGVIQWCNRSPQHSVDDMLSQAIEADPSCIKPLADLAIERAYTFQRVGGKYRFIRGGIPVDTVQEQQKLYFLNSNGARGMWDHESRLWAERWCRASAQVWDSEKARAAQLDYTAQRAQTFAFGVGKRVLEMMPDTSIGRAWRAMYLSFAANNPLRAARAVEAAIENGAGVFASWTEPWLANMAYMMTTHPGIAIYPHRYNKIRPVIEQLFGVNLPDYAQELSAWTAKKFRNRWYDPIELQRALLALGYDLGPRGADGDIGPKTREALLAFERAGGVPPEHQNGLLDEYTAVALEKALEKKGIAELT